MKLVSPPSQKSPLPAAQRGHAPMFWHLHCRMSLRKAGRLAQMVLWPRHKRYGSK